MKERTFNSEPKRLVWRRAIGEGRAPAARKMGDVLPLASLVGGAAVAASTLGLHFLGRVSHDAWAATMGIPSVAFRPSAEALIYEGALTVAHNAVAAAQSSGLAAGVLLVAGLLMSCGVVALRGLVAAVARSNKWQSIRAHRRSRVRVPPSPMMQVIVRDLLLGLAPAGLWVFLVAVVLMLTLLLFLLPGRIAELHGQQRAEDALRAYSEVCPPASSSVRCVRVDVVSPTPSSASDEGSGQAQDNASFCAYVVDESPTHIALYRPDRRDIEIVAQAQVRLGVVPPSNGGAADAGSGGLCRPNQSALGLRLGR